MHVGSLVCSLVVVFGACLVEFIVVAISVGLDGAVAISWCFFGPVFNIGRFYATVYISKLVNSR